MTRLTLLLLALASPAGAADNARIWPGVVGSFGPSSITLHEPTDPSAVATVTFVNTQVHSLDEVFGLTWGEIEVTVAFVWNADDGPAERIEIIPPDGYIAVPPVLDVAEYATGVVHIIAYVRG
jgi:hypothetical protein